MTFTITPEATTTYELFFQGARGLASAHSGRATVKVVKLPTALSVSTPTTPITIGTKETFTGTLVSGATPLASKGVELFTVNSKHKWVREVGHGTTSATGAVSITTTPATGTDSYVLVYGGDWQYAASASAVETVTVNKIKTALTLSSSAATTPVAKGKPVTLTATLTAGSTDLSHQTVVLQVLSKGKWVNAQAGTAKTGSAGTVTFTKTASATTSYRVAYYGSSVYATAYSTTVVVTVG